MIDEPLLSSTLNEIVGAILGFVKRHFMVAHPAPDTPGYPDCKTVISPPAPWPGGGFELIPACGVIH